MDLKNTRFNFTYFFIALMAILLIQEALKHHNSVVVPFSEFQESLKNEEVKEVMILNGEIKGILKKPRENDKKEVIVATKVEPEFIKYLDKFNVKYWKVIESTFFKDILSWVLPVLIFFGIWMYLSKKFMSQGGGGAFMSVGKSKAKVYVERDIKVSFNDVAGVDEAKAELEEIINFLKDPASYGRLGAKMPRGILLVGPPGTGKTLLAKAVAGEAKVPFFSISGSEFVEMFVGVGAARVRDLFEQARKQAPCIIFIDELDALGKARGLSPMGGHDEKEQTLNQLLVELDGFDTTLGVVLLAATNRPEILDPALLRAGRFDRQVLVDRPEKSGRLEILKVHIQKVKTSSHLKLEEVAALTPGFTGADLANLVNEAALSATRANREEVTLEDFNIAIERIVAGLEKKSRVLNKKEREIVAFHEMGHAFVAAALPDSDKVHKVSIIPRGIGALGYTIQRPTEDRYIMSPEELKNKMMILLGGRACEKLFFDSISTGSADDIVKVTEIARSMVTHYGMVPELGHMVYEENSNKFLENYIGKQKCFSEETANIIDKKVKELVDQAFAKAFLILKQNKDTIEKAANELLTKETLVEKELEHYFSLVEADITDLNKDEYFKEHVV